VTVAMPATAVPRNDTVRDRMCGSRRDVGPTSRLATVDLGFGQAGAAPGSGLLRTDRQAGRPRQDYRCVPIF
jgi:hypothetical protein